MLNQLISHDSFVDARKFLPQFFIGKLGVEFLEVLLVTYDNKNPEEALSNSSLPLHYRLTTLWRRRQITSGRWQAAQITYSTQQQHSIAFSGSPDLRYTKYRGFVAVDDITFSVGPCESEYLALSQSLKV